MLPPSPSERQELPTSERLARLEDRIARIEARLGAGDFDLVVNPPSSGPLAPAFGGPTATDPEQIELRVGQSWFARVGIAVLTLGIASILLLPFAGLPAIVPPLMGVGAAVFLFGIAVFWQRSFALVASYLVPAAMILLFLGALRLSFPSVHRVLAADSVVGSLSLVLCVAINGYVAMRRNSPSLAVLALTMGAATAVVVGAPWFVLVSVIVLAAASYLAVRFLGWRILLVVMPPIAFAAYLIWAVGNPIRGGSFAFTASPSVAPLTVLLAMAIFARGIMSSDPSAVDDATSNTASLVNCTFGYLTFVVHSEGGFAARFVALQLIASALGLATAVVFWRVERSRVSTFFYAMTGYLALSFAILKTSEMPNVFVWLSAQSLLVVTTAIWFRSRFIVVGNFLMYLAIVLGYMITTDRETGVSVGFGLVALLSARILNWQKARLELRTELMRNAYLLSAFIVFPYALHHLVAPRYVPLTWIGLAMVYYGLNLIVRNQKYRWMGHATLLVTTLYLAFVGTRQIEPTYRIVSFLVLGMVFVIVSLCFSRQPRGPRVDGNVPAKTSTPTETPR